MLILHIIISKFEHTGQKILILRLVRQQPRLKRCLLGNCVIPRNALYVIARSNATWQSPGRVTLLIIWWFLSNCQKDTLAIIYNDGFNNNVLINSGVDQVRKLVKTDKMAFIVLGFITMLPFREIATASPLAMPRNDIKCVARNNVKKVCRFCYYFSANKRLLCSVRSTLSF